MMNQSAKTITVDCETALAFTLTEEHADGRDGFQYVDVIEDGFDDHDIPQYILVLQNQSDGSLYGITYQENSEGYSSFKEWKTSEGILVERRSRVVHYYAPVDSE